MPHYLRWPTDTGATSTNRMLVQVSGLSGLLTKIKYKLAETMPAYTRPRYLFDIRRQLDSATNVASAGGLLRQNGAASTESYSTYAAKINGASVSLLAMFQASGGDVCEFAITNINSFGVMGFGGRHTEIESFYGLAIHDLILTDDNGDHVFDMSDSGGSVNQLISDTGLLTLKLFNAPVDYSHWVLFGGGPEAQDYSSGGTVAITRTAVANASSMHEQIFSSAGSVHVAKSIAGTNLAINAQEYSTSAAVAKKVGATLTSVAVNAQEFSGTGVVTFARSAVASTSSIDDKTNAQMHSSGGSTSRTHSADATTAAINAQQFSSSALVEVSRTVAASASAVDAQQFASGGQVSVSRSVVATTESINNLGAAQEFASGGVVYRKVNTIAVAGWLNEQQFASSGHVLFSKSAYATTSFFDDGYTPEFTSKGLSALVVKPKISAQVIKPGYSATLIK